DADRRAILLRAADSGCAYIDVETADIPFIAGKTPRSTLIVSMHDFAGTPENLIERVRELAALPADWVKFAVTHRHPADSVRVLDAIQKCPKPCIGIAMGEGGLMTRVLGPAYGSRVTFGSLDAGSASAPGQPTAMDLATIYRVRDITRETRVYGLLGNPVAQSGGYRLHNRAFERLGFDGVYIPFLAESAEEFLDAIPGAINLHGLSVTIPHKPAALRWATRRSETAERIEAANTLSRTSAGWRADNTDMPGIFESVKSAADGMGMNLTGTDALILGAGGTTRAAGMALSLLGCRITLSARNPEKAWQIASRMGWEVEGLSAAVRATSWTAVANTTPVGMYPNAGESLFPAENWRPDMLAFDAVHNPRQTRFLMDAALAGAATVDGVELFMRQAAEQFRLWTGRTMPRISSLTWGGRQV
ncbi:MAG: type I 3-dehydroquinate dehydratase, partial [Planctomycetota bacterium]|nr:type I 3-dehydroquinate dehydratase [Planctomycetota bacterium]